MSIKAGFKKLKGNFTGDVVSSFANNIWTIIRGPVTLLILIPLFLSDEAQGYWFTFGSLAALSTFADLGFTTIVSQFSAHEYSHLNFNSAGVLEGDSKHLDRIASLFRFIVKWAGVVTLVGFPVIMIIGGVVLNTHGNHAEWLVPWILYAFGSGGNFFIGSVLSFFEGCNQVGKIQRNRLVGSIVITLSTWIMLILNFGLYTLAISAVLGVVTNLTLLIIRFRKVLFQLIKRKAEAVYTWFREFMSLLWKYAISWGSGYFAFQIYTPIAYMVYDPIMAGKVGITMTLIQACFTIANVWIQVATPKVNIGVSLQKWQDTERLVKKNMLLAVATFLLGATAILGGYALFVGRTSILQKFLGLTPMAILLGAYFANIFVTAIAVYGRAHKTEPFVIHSLITCLSSALLTVGLVFLLPIDYMFAGFLVSNTIALLFFYRTYKTKKEKWHEFYVGKYCKADENSDANETKEELKEQNQ